MGKSCLRSFRAICVAVGVLLPLPALAGPFFMGLGDLPGGIQNSHALDISADGSTVVGVSCSASSDEEAFRWTAGGGMIGLGNLTGGSFRSMPFDVSADGSVVVGTSYVPSGVEAFRWTVGGGMIGLGDLPGGVMYSHGAAVSGDGSTVVGPSNGASGPEAFRWTEADGMVRLADETVGVIPTDTSLDGSVVVGYSGGEAIRWTSGGGVEWLGDLEGGQSVSRALGVSADGSVVVGDSFSASGHEAFRWTAGGGMVGLGVLPGADHFDSWALAASADGSIVVGESTGASTYQAFLWDETNGMRSLQSVLTTDFGLDLSGWRLSLAHGVSADGLVVAGEGVNPHGYSEAWIANLRPDAIPPTPASQVIPEPTTFALLALGMCGVGLRRRCR